MLRRRNPYESRDLVKMEALEYWIPAFAGMTKRMPRYLLLLFDNKALRLYRLIRDPGENFVQLRGQLA